MKGGKGEKGKREKGEEGKRRRGKGTVRSTVGLFPFALFPLSPLPLFPFLSDLDVDQNVARLGRETQLIITTLVTQFAPQLS